jgi:hypothetical protein
VAVMVPPPLPPRPPPPPWPRPPPSPPPPPSPLPRAPPRDACCELYECIDVASRGKACSEPGFGRVPAAPHIHGLLCISVLFLSDLARGANERHHHRRLCFQWLLKPDFGDVCAGFDAHLHRFLCVRWLLKSDFDAVPAAPHVHRSKCISILFLSDLGRTAINPDEYRTLHVSLLQLGGVHMTP